MIVGAVRSLHRYPIKSFLGESLPKAAISVRGVDHDRTHALIDVETGKVASAKRPQYWRSMLALSSRRDSSDPSLVHIRLPDGREISSADCDVDENLSRAIGRGVRLESARGDSMELERSQPDEALAAPADAEVANDIIILGQAAPAGGFFDFAPIHVVFVSSMRMIGQMAGLDGLEEARYRANLIIDDGAATPFRENDWLGRTLVIGGVELTFEHMTPRCAVPTLAHGALSPRPDVLRAIASANRREFLDMGPQPCMGVYASVRKPGIVGTGDSARLT